LAEPSYPGNVQPDKQEDTKNYASYIELDEQIRERFSDAELAGEMERAAEALMERFHMSPELRAQMRDRVEAQERKLGVKVSRWAS
jgi:hypothetical protein